MKLHLASTAELYAEHRRTGSTRKRQRIAAELQRRHDEQMQPPGLSEDRWWWPTGEREFVRSRFEKGGGHWSIKYYAIRRFEFALFLPVQSQLANRKSEILPS